MERCFSSDAQGCEISTLASCSSSAPRGHFRRCLDIRHGYIQANVARCVSQDGARCPPDSTRLVTPVILFELLFEQRHLFFR